MIVPGKLAESKNTDKSPGSSIIWIKKWVDYSTKYGLGYLLSNGSYGVFFNDATKIILDIDEEYYFLINRHFNYIVKRSSDKQDVILSYTLNEYPHEYNKKVTLLRHFKCFIEGKGKYIPDNEPPSTIKSNNSAGDNRKLPYVKKWMRTRHAIMFRLSNKIVQVIFQDHTEIVMSSETKEILYINKKGERAIYPLDRKSVV